MFGITPITSNDTPLIRMVSPTGRMLLKSRAPHSRGMRHPPVILDVFLVQKSPELGRLRPHDAVFGRDTAHTRRRLTKAVDGSARTACIQG